MSHLSRLDSLRWVRDSLVVSFTLTPTIRGVRRFAPPNRGDNAATTRVQVLICGGEQGDMSLPVTWEMRSAGRRGAPGGLTQCFVGEAVLTPVDASTGKALTGTWEVYTVLDTGDGISIQRMSGGIRSPIDVNATPGFVGHARTYVDVGLTSAAELVIRVDPESPGNLFPGVTVPRFKHEVGSADDGAAIRVPLRVHVADNLPVLTTLALARAHAEPSAVIRTRALIVGPQNGQPACLVATVPGGAIQPTENAQSWALHAEFGGAPVNLNHTLRYGGELDPCLCLGPAVTADYVRRWVRVIQLGARRAVQWPPRQRTKAQS